MRSCTVSPENDVCPLGGGQLTRPLPLHVIARCESGAGVGTEIALPSVFLERFQHRRRLVD